MMNCKNRANKSCFIANESAECKEFIKSKILQTCSLKLKYIVIIFFITSSYFCFSQAKDSIHFSIYTDPASVNRMDNYANYLKAIHRFINDFNYAKRVDSIKWRYSDNNDSIYSFRFGYDQIKRFTNLNNALASDHDSVYFLDLRNQNLKSFPKEIVLFKNLVYLDLKSVPRNEYIDSISPAEKQAYLESIKKNRGDDHGAIDYKSNTIRFFPEEVSQLKKLMWLRTDGINICQEEYDKLKMLLPNCYIETGIYENINDPEFDSNKKHCKEHKKKKKSFDKRK